MHHMSRLIRVRHTDEDVQRRGANIILMAVGLQVMALLLTIYAGFAGRLSTQVLIPVAISLIIQTMVIVLARRGSVDLAGGILVGMTIVGITGGAIFSKRAIRKPDLWYHDGDHAVLMRSTLVCHDVHVDPLQPRMRPI